MKRFLLIPVIAVAILVLNACAELANLQSVVPVDSFAKSDKLTTDEVIRGLKEALTVGAKNSIRLTSRENGFYGNPRIAIPFPPEADKMRKALLKAGLKRQVEKFTLTMNRAAEEAVKQALPIFTEAVTSMSVSDAMGILNGPDNAATQYFRQKTDARLYNAFTPIVKDAIGKVKLTAYWKPLAKAYNRICLISGGEPVNPNLNEYITRRAIDGLFVLIEQEEKNIRNNPAARVSDILKRVFGR